MAMPMLSIYAATKAFEDHFSLSLAAELAPDRIDVLCLRPGNIFIYYCNIIFYC